MKNLEKPMISKLVFGYSLMFLSLYVFYNIAILFGALLLGTSIVLISRNGSEIKLEERKYRTFTSFFGIEFGIWKDLPKIEYISVFKTTETKSAKGIMMSPLGTPNQAQFKSVIYKLLLFYQTNKKIEVLKTDTLQEAFKEASFMADYLEVKVLDATQKPSVWM